ncbi:hypothetical protein CDAR_86541 [Caerostris darwini]|uniref:Uncharacterized protein n=1 Tax=Caerostris darwini TaxID=1538125 RepID=A0AAV4UGE6_9ARAC|nr:hypothetical protein CDAR_86541 [Caerostris darwini]
MPHLHTLGWAYEHVKAIRRWASATLRSSMYEYLVLMYTAGSWVYPPLSKQDKAVHEKNMAISNPLHRA